MDGPHEGPDRWDNLAGLAEEPARYRNQLAESYREEADAARAARVAGVTCPSEEFEMLAAEGERLVFVVRLDRALIVAPQLHRGFEVRHPVLAGGAAVLAAGEIELVYFTDVRVVLDLTNKSGHYRPHASCLEVTVEVLVELGFEVPAGVIRPYPGG